MIAEVIFLNSFLVPATAIFCYQCATDQEPFSEDRCGTRGSFRPEEHAVVDCGRDEATSPGQMCLKYTQLSPRAFIRDKRWKSVIRRCAQVSSRGQLQGCDWGYDSRGTYWEQCHCTRDGCNSVSNLSISRSIFFLVSITSFSRYLLILR